MLNKREREIQERRPCIGATGYIFISADDYRYLLDTVGKLRDDTTRLRGLLGRLKDDTRAADWQWYDEVLKAEIDAELEGCDAESD